MTVVVMRHGIRDQRVDSPLIGYQPSDLDNSCPEIWKTIQELVPYVATGQLSAIVASPYLRTRQTAELVRYGLAKLTGHLLPVSIDLRIGEYMHRRCLAKCPTKEDFDPETWRWYRGCVPLCRESIEVCSLRVYRFHQELNERTLVVTHNGIAMMLGQCCGQKIGLGMGHYSLLDRYPDKAYQVENA